MKGDFTRRTFDRRKHYSSVRMQQGRVQIDADWNELVEILQGLMRRQTADVMGPHGVPIATPDAFRVEATSNNESGLRSMRIHAGRIYVDGVLCELDEDTDFTNQPDFPGAKLGATFPALVYLEVREPLITALEDPSIAEIALGGPDTAARTRALCQVKLFPITTPAIPAVFDFATLFPVPPPPAIDLDDSEIPRENQLYRVEIHRSGAFKLDGDAPAPPNNPPTLVNEQPVFRDLQPIDGPTTPATVVKVNPDGTFVTSNGDVFTSDLRLDDSGNILTPDGSVFGPGGLRVKPDGTLINAEGGAVGTAKRTQVVAAPGNGSTDAAPPPAGQPTFKWSRDNGSVLALWTQTLVRPDGALQVEVNGLRRATFQVDDFVELTDDSHELRREPGELRRILGIENLPGLQRLTLDTAGGDLATRLAEFTDDNTVRKKKARRWESGEIALGTKVSLPGGGVAVSFGDGQYTTGDAWIMPVRQGSLESDVMTPAEDPPHYAELAVISDIVGGSVTLEDRRTTFSPIPEVQRSLVPPGAIVMWSGAETSVPAGWVLCDGRLIDPANPGRGNTPDLRSRFIMGADASAPVGTPGGPDLHHHTYRIEQQSISVGVPAHTHRLGAGTWRESLFVGVNVGVNHDGKRSGDDLLFGATSIDTGGDVGVFGSTGPVDSGDGSASGTIGPLELATREQTGNVRPAFFALAFIMKQ